ncbi:hypothetical protein [Virgibacillus ndiopensis]|uniref:hypothetical protein n=1 Tax=Virgibacillus ndiopensis TaxID=2004408 RepID=UPI000C08B147|nr:hypothetical protein [Virgibacillus ndiopensis]
MIVFYNYNKSTSYFGFVEVGELGHIDNEFIVTVEGNFGIKTSVFDENEFFTIFENEEPRDGNITMIWNYLSEGKTFYVLLKSYDNRSQFDLERIYID